MKLTMLGTGNALVTQCYNTCFVLEDGANHCILVDGGGGNGVLRQLRAAGYDWMAMRDIIVTHRHIDHLLGIVWMMRMICQYMKSGQYTGEARIYGHDEVIVLLQDLAQKLLQPKEAHFIGERLHLITVHDGETKTLAGHAVTFFDIQSTKAKQYGFALDLTAGKCLVCCGDEPYNPCEERYAKGCTWLLHEAFCLYGEADMFHPYEKHHSTVKDACELAASLGAANVILYHTEDSHLQERKALYTAEGKQYYTGHLYVPDDLETIQLD